MARLFGPFPNLARLHRVRPWALEALARGLEGNFTSEDERLYGRIPRLWRLEDRRPQFVDWLREQLAALGYLDSGPHTVDFSAYTTAANAYPLDPDHWVRVYNTGNPQLTSIVEGEGFVGGKALKLHREEGGNSQVRGVAYTGVAPHTDVEVYLELIADPLAETIQNIHVYLRGNGQTNTSRDGLALQLNGGSTIQLVDYTNGSGSGITGTTSFPIAAGDRVKLRYRVEGTAASVKAWKNDEPEPETAIRSGTTSKKDPGSLELLTFAVPVVWYVDYLEITNL